MGRNRLITPAAAGEILGVGGKTVRRYVQRGWLHPVYDKNRGLHGPLLLKQDEVAGLAEALDGKLDLVALTQRATQAYTTARALERRVERLEQLVGAQYESPPLNYESVLALYAEARDDLEITPVDSERVERWTRTFMSLGEEFFDALEAFTHDEKAWQVFHDLSRAIIEEAPLASHGHEEEVRARYRYYERARRNLRTVLFFHIRTRFGSRRALQMFRDETNLHERVKSYLNPGQSAPATSPQCARPSLVLVK